MKIRYPVPQVVSVWIGTFAEEDQMDRCTDNLIEPSLNLPVPMNSICEVTFEEQTVPVRQLLAGFSGWETFVDQACEAAERCGVEDANSALVCFYLLCEAPPNNWDGMTFLGSFSDRDNSDNP